YAPPGYILLQYYSGVDTISGKQLGRHSTVIWDSQRREVPLTIDPHWTVSNVQPDGRISFTALEADSGGYKRYLFVTRIEP
ncbi:MAG TPA: hypothetical protein VMS71_04150, partial [Candidatus Acidoferrum sp.]|nr:hypothetical protein [Candidatus Acidoferrum sp.]